MTVRTNDRARLALGLLAAALLIVLPVARGQQSAPKPANPPPAKEKEAAPADKPSLEDLLAEALKNNPDIRVAEAKVAEAEAVLNRSRLQVMQKVATVYATRKAARDKVTRAEQDLERARKLQGARAISEEDYRAMEHALILAKAELELVEAELPALLGKPPQKVQGEKTGLDEAAVQNAIKYLHRLQIAPDLSMTEAGLRALAGAYRQEAARSVPGSVAEKVRKALDTPIAVDFKDVPFTDVLKDLQDKTGIALRSKILNDPKITLKLPGPLPLGAVLQALEDEPRWHDMGYDPSPLFVVRDYGLLFAPSDAIPPGAVLLHHLAPAVAGATNPPAEHVEGVVTKTDPAGLVTISIGSDAGLAKGRTLEVYRLNPAKYLGTVRVIQTTPHEAIVQPASKLLAPIQVGDRVSSQVLGPGK